MISRLQISLIYAIIIICSLDIYSQDTLYFENIRDIDICSNDRMAVVIMSIGEIAPQDSMFGFDFAINYDPNLLKFGQGLINNTVAEFSDAASVNATSIPGEAAGYLGMFGLVPYSGNAPLIGFTAEFLGDCNDTATIELKYIAFTEEFTSYVSDTIPANIYSLNNPKSNIWIELEKPEKDTIINNDTLEIKLEVDYEGDRILDNFTILYSTTSDFEGFTIEHEMGDIEGIDSVKFERDSFDRDVMIFYLNEFTGDYLGTLKVFANEDILEDKSFILQIDSPEVLEECPCYNLASESSIQVNYKYQDTVNSVKTELQAEDKYQLIVNNDNLKISTLSNNDLINKIEIYDFAGNLIYSENANNRRDFNIAINNYYSGIYLVVINNKEKQIFTKVK